MEQDLFQLVPSDITINILSRLDVRTIGKSKCVCKPWLDLLSSNGFVKSHLSKSVPVLAVLLGEMTETIQCKVLEFEEEDDYVYDVDLHYYPLTTFYFGRDYNIAGAVDGLLLLQSDSKPSLSICNPLTREYVELCGAVKLCGTVEDVRSSLFGFGASKITWQHKVVQIVPKRYSGCKCRVNVYTLETGTWRRLEATVKLDYNGTYGAFVNGNLHWKGSDLIACFDLETERFTMLSGPPLEVTARPYETSVCALKDCLCVCAVMPLPSEDVFVVEIWLMKEYGVEKSWTKEYVVRIPTTYDCLMDKYHYVRPLKVFKDGDILFSMVTFELFRIFHYSNEYGYACKIDELDLPCGSFPSVLVTPSFLTLKSFGIENASILEYVSEDDEMGI